MNTKQKINTLVNDKISDYKNESIKSKILIWILTMDGEILIKNPDIESNSIRVTSLTMHSSSIKGAIKRVEKETGILCNSELFKKLLTSKSISNEEISYEMYTLCINLDKEHKDLIEEIAKAKFIDYRDLMTYLADYDLTLNCKDKLLTLISSLYENYTFF